ncbi:MAG: peptidase S41, partial [Pseudomonadota bacterium]
GINGDGYFFTTLPHSGIEFDVPIVGKFPLTPQPDAGVSPDLMVKESVADIVKGKDRTMDAAVSLLS